MTAARVAGADMAPVLAFLGCPTPGAWIDAAVRGDNLHTLLVDHANCEKKAASTALNLMYRYTQYPALLRRLSRLAREELRHFEQVLSLLQARGLDYPPLSAARYASGLRAKVSSEEPQRLVDTLLVGALIEARSCERFAALVPVLDRELAAFYGSLLRSEARHFGVYLQLARDVSSQINIEARLEQLRECEAELVTAPDAEFRFHSGPPASVD